MNEQNEKITELTPDQIEKVNGGFRRDDQCPLSPDKLHRWIENNKGKRCRYCNKAIVF